jgi:hypothetical protein
MPPYISIQLYTPQGRLAEPFPKEHELSGKLRTHDCRQGTLLEIWELLLVPEQNPNTLDEGHIANV